MDASPPAPDRPDVAGSSREASLQAILDAAVDGILTIDLRGTILMANPATEQIFGHPRQQLIGRNVRCLMPALYGAEHDGYLRRYAETRVARIIGAGREVVGLRANGEEFPMHLSVSEVRGAEPTFVGIVHDLTAIRAAMQEKREAERGEASLGRILENSLNEFYIVDSRTGRFLLVNRGARENLGYSLEQLRALTPEALLVGVDHTQLGRLLQPLREGRTEQVYFDAQHLRRDGSRYDVHVHVQAANYRGLDVLVASVTDDTAHKQAQRELARLNRELRQRVDDSSRALRQAQRELLVRERLAALGQLAGSVAHEIRNPLAVIGNATYYLQQACRVLTDPETHAAIEEIVRALASVNRIVAELLDYARQPACHPRPCGVRAVVEGALQATRVGQGVAVELDLPDDLPLLQVDPEHVQQILVNLIANAVQAVAPTGHLRIAARRVPAHAAQPPSESQPVDGSPGSSLMEISLADDGPGIPTTDLERVFEPLFSTKTQGIGFGLAVSRRYAELNGGSLHAVDRTGGATFVLRLPEWVDPELETSGGRTS